MIATRLHDLITYIIINKVLYVKMFNDSIYLLINVPQDKQEHTSIRHIDHRMIVKWSILLKNTE